MNHGMKADKYEISVNYKVTNERPYLKLRKKFAAPRGNKIFPIGEQKNGKKKTLSPTLPITGEDKDHESSGSEFLLVSLVVSG